MNTLDMPMNYVPALEEQDAVAKDASEASLAVDLMALIDDYGGEEWTNDDGEDLLAALGGETFEQALEEGVTLLDGVGGLPEEDILNFVTEGAVAPSSNVKLEPKEPFSSVADEDPGYCTPIRESEVFALPVLSPFSMNSASIELDIAACHPSDDIWAKFEFPTDICNEKKPMVDLLEYSEKFSSGGIPKIDWDYELAHEEQVPAKKPKQEYAEGLDIMWSARAHNNQPVEMPYRPKPMLTPAQLRRKLMTVDCNQAGRVVAVTPDNALPLANRSTTVPAATAVKTRPMRSLLNTQKPQQNAKTNSRSLLLPSARSKSQEIVVAPSVRGSKTVKTVVSVRAPPADSSAPKNCSRKASTDDAPGVVHSSGSPRPETPQSIAESEDEAPVFRHNTIDTIFTSTLCDASSSSTMYLTPSDSSGSPKSTFCEDYDDDLDDYDDFETEEGFVSDHSNLRSPPESVIREERPARTVLPYISDHSYHLSKSSVRTDNLGVQTPSDSEEEIDVVSVGGDKSSARLPNNPSARDRRQIQQKVASAIQRNGGRQPEQMQQQPQAETPAVTGKKRQQQVATAGRGGQAKRARLQGTGARGRRRVNSDEEPDPCEKRSMHNSMERQRRIDLRNLVEKLRLLVPATEGNKRAAKVVILREAAEYCRINTPIVEEREALVKQLQARQEALKARLSQLRSQLAAARLQTDVGEE